MATAALTQSLGSGTTLGPVSLASLESDSVVLEPVVSVVPSLDDDVVLGSPLSRPVVELLSFPSGESEGATQAERAAAARRAVVGTDVRANRRPIMAQS